MSFFLFKKEGLSLAFPCAWDRRAGFWASEMSERKEEATEGLRKVL